MNIAINGFGRIGRCVCRAVHNDADLNLVGINDLGNPADLAYLLRYDSVHGRFDDVEQDGNRLVIDGHSVPLFQEREPGNLPWDDTNVDVVLECTGQFRTRDGAAGHLNAGAGNVVISAPPKSDDVPQFVYGVNHSDYAGEQVVSGASCTTNCLAPMAQVLDEVFGIVSATATTVHAYTGSQHLVDGTTGKRRRGRAAAENIVPTTTGAADAVTDVLPMLDGKLDAKAMRVPVPNGSIVDLTARLNGDITAEQVNRAFQQVADRELAGVLQWTGDAVVSRDIIGNPYSCIIDGASTTVQDDLVNVLGWYDNEYGYANRILDLARHVTGPAQ